MKILHMSDLHIGKNVNGFPMINEQRHVFRQIIAYIQIIRPGAVVIAGDVYDRAMPGIEAVRVFDDFLTELAREGIAIIIISGNHDSPERLNYASRLLMEKKVFLCGAFDGNLRKVIMTDEYGDICFWLLPFIKPSSVRGLLGESDIESYDDALIAALATADIDDTARNVLVAHQFFIGDGDVPIRCESEMNLVGGLDAMDVKAVGRFDYAALGHLHRAQRVGSECIRYAGSPLKYSFSEVRHEKSVTLVELAEKGSLTVTALPLSPLHDMREIKGKLDVLMSDEVSCLADKEDYLRVILTDEDEIIDPIGKLRSVYPNIMTLDFSNRRSRVDMVEITLEAEQASALSPYELFNEFFLDVNGSVMSGEQAKIVKELLETEESE